MAAISLGKVSLAITGDYDATTEYQPLDMVFYDNSSYVAVAPVVGELPPNSSKWQIFAKSVNDTDIYNIIDIVFSDVEFDVPRLTIEEHNGDNWLTYYDSEGESPHYLKPLGAMRYKVIERDDNNPNEVNSCTDENTIYKVYLRSGVVTNGWADVICVYNIASVVQYAMTTSKFIIFRKAPYSGGTIGTWESWDYIPTREKVLELIPKATDLTADNGYTTPAQVRQIIAEVMQSNEE